VSHCAPKGGAHDTPDSCERPGHVRGAREETDKVREGGIGTAAEPHASHGVTGQGLGTECYEIRSTINFRNQFGRISASVRI